MFPWHQYLLGLLFIFGGVNHFRKPKFFERIMPPYIPAQSSLVLAIGIIEMILGFMLITNESQSIGAWGIILLLIVFIPIHVFMLQNKKASLNLPKWLLIIIFPFQFALIYWAYLYT